MSHLYGVTMQSFNRPTEPGCYIWSVPATEGIDPHEFHVEVKLVDGKLNVLDEHGTNFGTMQEIRSGSGWERIATPQ